MNNIAFDTTLSSGLQKLESTKSAARDPETVVKQNHAATEFEAVFMSMLLKQMRETLEEGIFGNEHSDSYGALFDIHMGQHLSNQGGLGIKELVLNSYMLSGPSVDSNTTNAEASS